MKFDLDQSTIQLTQGKLISLPDAEGSTVAVLWGSVWLTQDGDSRDYELNSGESFTIRGDGMIVISAFENSAVTILEPCEDVALASKRGESVNHATGTRDTNGKGSVRYLSGDELDQYKRNAHELRARYMASLFKSLGRALRHGFTKLGDRAVALWLNNTRRQWTAPRRRLYW